MKIITPDTRMADLIEANYSLLHVLTRLGIDGAFGERTVREECEKHHIDTGTLILICNVYSRSGYTPSGDMLSDGRVEDILRYLHLSHDYYINDALVIIDTWMEELISPCTSAQKQVIRTFFTEYKSELEKHFAYEENEVIPYVQDLLLGKRSTSFSIDRFEENHSNIDEKLSDLKSLILKSLPQVCDNSLRVRLLTFLYALQDDLACHTRIEDGVDIYTQGVINYPHATSSFTLGIGVKTEGNLVVSGTKGYVYVPAPWWLTDYFELRYEDQSRNRKYFYSYDGEGLRYELQEFLSMIVNGRRTSYKMRKEETLAIVEIIEKFRNGENVTRI